MHLASCRVVSQSARSKVDCLERRIFLIPLMRQSSEVLVSLNLGLVIRWEDVVVDVIRRFLVFVIPPFRVPSNSLNQFTTP